jgi:uncharacterized protein
MGLFRLLTFILIILIAWRMIKNYQAKLKTDVPKPKITARERVVKCEYCATHIPEEDAINEDSLYFCCQDHKERFKDA